MLVLMAEERQEQFHLMINKSQNKSINPATEADSSTVYRVNLVSGPKSAWTWKNTMDPVGVIAEQQYTDQLQKH